MNPNFRYQTFLYALHKSSVENVKAMINAGLDLDFVDDQGETLLLYILKYLANEEIVKFLLKKGVQVNVADKEGNSPLHYAAVAIKDENIFREMLDKCDNVNVKNARGQTVLLYGIQKQASYFVIKILLDKGADMKLHDNEGKSLLDYIELYNPPLLGVFLFAKGHEIDIKDKGNNTPLMIALSKNKERLAEKLVNLGADISCKNNIGQTPLHIAACGENVQSVRLLMDKGAEVHSRNDRGETPLYLAVVCCQEKIALELLKNVTEFNETDENGNNILQISIACKMSGKMIKKLLEKGVDKEHKNRNGESALHVLFRHSNWDAFNVLVENHVNVNAQNSQGDSTLHFALKSILFDYERTLVLQTFCQQLIFEGANVNLKNNAGQSPLLLAVSFGFPDRFLMYLVIYGANMNNLDSDRNSLIHFAVKKDSYDLITFLIEYGIDVSTPNSRGQTPLSIAAKFCNEKNIFLLLDFLDIETILKFKDENRNSLFHISLNRNMENLFVFLLMNGADLFEKDSLNQTPIDLAALKVNNFFISKILEWGGIQVLKYLRHLNRTKKRKIYSAIYSQAFKQAVHAHYCKIKCAHLQGVEDLWVVLNDSFVPDLTSNSKKQYEDKCHQELLTIQGKRYGHNSLGDIFKQYSDPRYLSNKELEQIFATDEDVEDLNQTYPIYGFMLRGTYVNAKIRTQLLDRAQETITILFQNALPRSPLIFPLEIGRMVSSFLNDFELQMLLTALSQHQSVARKNK